MLYLNECKEKDIVRIVQVNGSGLLKKRLLEIGFKKGAEIKIVKYAPLRDPIEVALGDSHISLRVKEAALLGVVNVNEK